jgi:MerR family transcriptional regulator, copper efflux regulator
VNPEADPSIACSLTSIDYRERADRWREVLAGTASEWTADGAIRTALPVHRLPALAELVAAESRCCPFLSFDLTVTADGAQLHTHAPAGARALLNDLFPDIGPARSAC